MEVVSGTGRTILALNCGSSSLKFGVYAADTAVPTLLCEGEAEEIGSEQSTFSFQCSGGSEQRQRLVLRDHAEAFACALRAVEQQKLEKVSAAGHRFVHGGAGLREHSVITEAVADELRSAVDFAPLHVPAALAVLEEVRRRLPGVPQVACLDTAFHRSMPGVAKTLALPAEIRERGVERFGFHGLSLESVVAQLSPVPSKLVVAHLGGGCSITAIRDGLSIDTSMGLTPAGGVMMGTRSGDLDPGVPVYLLRSGYADANGLEQIFDRQSGLKGVSGGTSDVRELMRLRKSDPRADLALSMFCYQVRKAIASMAAALEGIDRLVFAGGIGEHATELRQEICIGLRWLGEFVSGVVSAQEDLQIAKITARLAW